VRALIDPLSDHRNLSRCERIAAHRHARFIALAEDSLHEQTSLAVARDDRGAGESAFQRRLFAVKAQLSHRLPRAVALITASREDRLDLAFEVNPRLRRRAGNR